MGRPNIYHTSTSNAIDGLCTLRRIALCENGTQRRQSFRLAKKRMITSPPLQPYDDCQRGCADDL